MGTVKGTRQWESRGVWNVSICPNLARTAAIKVCLPFNFAVVFDFTYFRFCPSKAKSIGDVLTNRQNAANCCLHREWKKSVESLWIGILVLRQYIDATMHPAPLGNGVQICSVWIFLILFRGFFSVRRASPYNADWLGASIGIIKEGKKHRSHGSVSPIRYDITYWFCFTGAETEIHKIEDDSKIKREKNINCLGQRHIVNVWHLSDPPSFLLTTTFKWCVSRIFFPVMWSPFLEDHSLHLGRGPAFSLSVST